MEDIQKTVKKYNKLFNELNQIVGEFEKAILKDKDFIELVKDIIYCSYCSYRFINHKPYYRLMEQITEKQLGNCGLRFNKDNMMISVFKSGYYPQRYGVFSENISEENLDRIIKDLEIEKEKVIIIGMLEEKANESITKKNNTVLLKKIEEAIKTINPILNEKKKSEKYEVRFDDEYVYLVSVEGDKEEKMNLYWINSSHIDDRVGLIHSEDPNPFINITSKMYTKFDSLFRKKDIKILN